MTIGKTFKNYEEFQFALRINDAGEYVYQDMCGYKTYKTLAGLERMLRRYGYLKDGEHVTEV